MRSPRTLVLACAALLGAGCATSHVDQLHSRAERIETSLRREQAKVLEGRYPAESRQQRLDHLTELRASLSAANVGLGAVRFLPEQDREAGYDVLDEVYGTIEWNIPLSPSETPRSLPPQFTGGQLRLQEGSR